MASKQVRVKLTDTGKLGVKMRSQNVNTGTTSAIRYYPPLDTWQNLGKYSAKDTPFRLQFTCVNPRSGSDKPTISQGPWTTDRTRSWVSRCPTRTGNG